MRPARISEAPARRRWYGSNGRRRPEGERCTAGTNRRNGFGLRGDLSTPRQPLLGDGQPGAGTIRNAAYAQRERSELMWDHALVCASCRRRRRPGRWVGVGSRSPDHRVVDRQRRPEPRPYRRGRPPLRRPRSERRRPRSRAPQRGAARREPGPRRAPRASGCRDGAGTARDRRAQADAATAQVLREIGEHLRPGHIDRRAGLGVENDGPRIRGLGDPTDPGAHMIGVGEEQARLHPHHPDTRHLLGRRVARPIDPGRIGARGAAEHGHVRARRPIDQQHTLTATMTAHHRQPSDRLTPGHTAWVSFGTRHGPAPL
jgi:hypothetical protein